MDPIESIIESADIPILEAAGFLSTAHDGIRQISRSSIFTSSSSDHSSDSGVDVRRDLCIPDILNSPQTIEWLGFSRGAASLHWHVWLERPRDWMVDFEEMLIDEIRDSDKDAEGLAEDWDGVMRSWGINDKLRNAILDDEFTDIRTTASAKFWVIDTIEAAWHALFLIRHSAHELSYEVRQGIDARRQVGAQCPLPSPTSLATTQLRGGKLQEPTVQSERTPGTIILYKGVARFRTEEIVPETGHININRLASTPPTDFVGLAGAVFYFCTDRDVAEHYCKYAKKRADIHPTCILEMAVPNSLITQACPDIVQYGDEWKQLIWHSRRGHHLPKEIRHLGRRALLIGDICHSHNKAIARLNHWSEITENCILYTNRETKDPRTGEISTIRVPATQYVWWGDDVMATLEENCVFTITRSLAG